ncbi:MAG: dihydroorotase family protein [Nanoarchaeota archaeon]|nr:dihydroorotase family protein [Nanoarchaeota archaeon]
MSLVLKNCKVFTEGKLVAADILIENGRIRQIGQKLTADIEEDISGKTVLPGLIDVHVHFRDPGQTHKEDFCSGSKAAAAGGVTTILDMPNNSPPIISQDDLEKKKEAAKKSIVNYGFYVGATTENLDILNDTDAVAIKAYLGSSTGDLLLDNPQDLAHLLHQTKKPVVVHAENEKLITYFSQKYAETKMHHKMRDNLAALVSTVTAALLANMSKKHVHIAHLSTKEEIDFLRANKPPSVTCEVAPHHLFLDNSFFKEHGNFGKMNPPLRSVQDREALWQGIKEGIVDLIATDHAPHTVEEKRAPFETAPCGVPGVQTMLPLLLNEVNKGTLGLCDIVKLCAEHPAKHFGIMERGQIKEGFYADLVVIDMKKEETITNNQQFSKCGWTPFDGISVKGWLGMTIVNGNIVYKEGKFFEQEGMYVKDNSRWH